MELELSVELNDYVLRGLVKNGPTLDQWKVLEIVLPYGIFNCDLIVDEMGLYEVLKRNIQTLGGKNQLVRFCVPDTSVFLKRFEHPEDIKVEDLLGYVQMERGRTIHLPFHEALLDVYDNVSNDGHAVLFAVPAEEVKKIAGILQDVQLEPEVADIRALCNLRLLEKIERVNEEKTYLIADWSINKLSVCIYTNGNAELLRFLPIDTDLNKWVAKKDDNEVKFTYGGDMDNYMDKITNQILELERILDFFRLSHYKGDKSVDEIIIMGDNPYLQEISDVIRGNINTSLQIIDDAVMKAHYPQFKAKHASLIGLALKEV